MTAQLILALICQLFTTQFTYQREYLSTQDYINSLYFIWKNTVAVQKTELQNKNNIRLVQITKKQ